MLYTHYDFNISENVIMLSTLLGVQGG